MQKKKNSITTEPRKIPYIIYSESTPNPSVMKFVANKLLVKKDKECKSIKDTGTNTLLQKIFDFPFVQEIYIAENYISIKKHDIVEWSDVTNQIRIFIQEELNNNTKIYQLNPTSKHPTKKASKFLKEIEEFFESSIRPNIQMDGGDIEIISLENKVLKVFLKGACNGCPSSQITLKDGIAHLLQQKFPNKISEVIAIND